MQSPETSIEPPAEPSPSLRLQDDLKANRRRREKPQLSCNLCRKRKLKCDRGQPCRNCARRGLIESCVYARSNGPRPAPCYDPPPQTSTDSRVRDRVRILEERVAQLLNATGGGLNVTPSDIAQPALPTPSASATPHSVQGVATDRTSGGSGDQDHDHDHDHEDVHRYAYAKFKVDSPGLFTRSSTSVTYVGSAHWMAILEAIPGLDEVLNASCMTETTAGYGDTGMQCHQKMDLLLPSCKTLDKAEILAALPPKETVDILMAECILHTSQEPMIVHAPTFYKEYAEFWADPASASTSWLGLLFALMTLGVQYQQFTPGGSQEQQQASDERQPAETEQIIKKYRERTIECLLLSKYINGPPYALQTLLLLIFGDFTRGDSTENVNGLWVLWGTIVQIALRSGYHRDGAHFFPSLTPFEAETRRRIWAIMLEWDMYVSVSFGLPRNINLQQCDTAEPRNLRDEDLYIDMTELPPSRPETEYTRPQYHNDMNRLMQVLSDISDATCTTSIPSLSKVTRLDTALNNIYHQISARWAPTAPMDTDSDAANPDADSDPDPDPCDSVQFTFMTLMYLRAKITLHRKFLFQGRRRRGVPVHVQCQESRNTCLEAALAMLQHQWSLYLQTRVGGPLCRDSRKLLTPLVPDFLLATAVLCAELAMDLESKAPVEASGSGTRNDSINGAGAATVSVTNDSNSTDDMPDRVYHALSSAYIVWLYENDVDASRGVKMIVAALNHLLGKAQVAGYGTWKSSLSLNRRSWAGRGQQQGQQQQQQQQQHQSQPPASAQTQAQQRYGHGSVDKNPNSPAVGLDNNNTTAERGEAGRPPQRQMPYSGIGNFPI
ncbi:Fusarisetin A cluster transcription factor fsa6 [Exophiala dermatitidis]